MNALWAIIAGILPSNALEAPVYVQVSESVLKRSGTYQYKANDAGLVVLFCIATPPRVKLRCLVRGDELLVIVELTATDQDT